MSKNPAQRLIEFGQSVWYDNISRDLLNSGEIARLISEWGVRGMTSNPTIFDKAISSSEVYDEQINQLKPKGLSVEEVFEELALADIAEAADLLLPVFEESAGEDGYISIEVSPLLATDTAGTVSEGKKLFDKLIKYKDEDIKMPIAASLHDIAKIIGPEASKETIFPALDLLLKEHSDKIKLSAIAHLSDFVELFDKVTQ